MTSHNNVPFITSGKTKVQTCYILFQGCPSSARHQRLQSLCPSQGSTLSPSMSSQAAQPYRDDGKGLEFCQLPTKGTKPQRTMSLPTSPSPWGSSAALIPSFSFPQEYLPSGRTEEQVSILQIFPSACSPGRAELARPLTSQRDGGDPLARGTPCWPWRGWGQHRLATRWACWLSPQREDLDMWGE